jgi:hypothetical protein
MDEHDHSGEDVAREVGWMTILAFSLVAILSLSVAFMMFSAMAQIGPEVGEIVAFNPGDGPRYWMQPGMSVAYASRPGPRRRCILMPPVMSAGGGSLVIEAKEITQPPVFRVHWSGSRTDNGDGDCGRSADLILPLVQLRALANIAGGFGVTHQRSLF